MKLILFNNEYWIKDDAGLSSNFDSMKDHVKWWNIYKNNLLLHRLNGPARIYPNGNEYWYLNGKEVYYEIYQKIQNSTKEELLMYMVLPKYKDYISLIEYRLNL